MLCSRKLILIESLANCHANNGDEVNYKRHPSHPHVSDLTMGEAV